MSEPQAIYNYIVGTESAANAVSRNSRTKVYTPIVSYPNGGRMMTTRERINEAVKSKKKWDVYVKEQEMCRVMAMYGHDVIHRHSDEEGDTYDAIIDGVKVDLKKTKSHNNIVGYGKWAIEHQGAAKVVFQFDNDTEEITKKRKELTRKYGIHGWYFYSDRKKDIRRF